MKAPLSIQYLTAHELADELGVTLRTLKGYRDSRNGPPVTYLGGKPRYRSAAVEAWLRELENVPLRKSLHADFKYGRSA